MYRKQLLKLIFCPLFLLLSTWAFAQKITVTGKVTDEKGQALPGATVTIKNSTTGTNSDINGKYVLKANGSDVLVFSMLGFVNQEIPVNNRDLINVQLAVDQQTLNEVVVIGYGTQKRKDITGSVATVKSDDFKDQPIDDPISALQGRIAGVNIVESSGQPGATPSIVIRGISSLSQPIPLYIVDGVRIPDITNLNMQDIASVDVLKDAAAAAIYGSAAAGGVLLITTKKGAVGAPPTINFSARYGVTQPKLVNDLLNSTQFIALQNLVNPGDFAGATQTDTLPNVNWENVLYRNAVEENYNLSVAGATPKLNYLFSVYDNNQTGSFIDNSSEIAGIRANAEYKLSDFITIGEQIGLSQRKTLPVAQNVSLDNAPFRTQPIIPVFNENGSYGTEPQGYQIQFSGPNPFGAVNTASTTEYTNNVQANVYADIKLPLHLDFRSTFGYTYNAFTEDYFQNAFNAPGAQTYNTLTENYAEYNQLLANYVLSYNQSFGKHSISAIAGFEQITGASNNLYTSMGSIGQNGYTYIPTSSSAGQTTLSGGNDPNALIQSLFARVNYNFNERYFLSASIRQDANYTEFGPAKVKGVFPGASAGWNISDESFFQGAKNIFNTLKLRASYGSLGNSNIPPYSYSSVYNQNQLSSGISGGAQGFAPGQAYQIANTLTKLANPGVHWETVTETNIGLDGEALNGRLSFTAEWYNKTTTGMLYPLPLPTSSGFIQPYYANVGNVNNRGFDFSAGYRDKIGKFGYDVNVTAGFNKNNVVSLSGTATGVIYDGYNWYNNGNTSFNQMSNQNITESKAGLPFGTFYGYKVLGIFQTNAQALASGQTVNGNPAQAGDLIFQNLHPGQGINSSDDQPIGNPNPALVYGINIHLNYQGFDLGLLFNGVQGVKLFDGTEAYEESLFADGNTTTKALNDSYLGSNGLTSQPRLLGTTSNGGTGLDPNTNYSSVNSYFVQNGSYLKLKNLQLGYTFSGGVLQQLSVKKARVFVMANNVFTITKYTGLDPELGSAYTASGYGAATTNGIDTPTNYPQTKIYSVGLDVTF
jgi:TonB-linked SusC/RagA family outer membrane protein